jgi:hypothetical protein
MIVMLAAEIGVGALGLLFYLRARNEVLRAFREFDTAVPRSTAIALSPWLVPGALALAAALSIAALALPLRRSQKHFLVGLGLLLASAVVIFAIVAAFWPIFQPA